MQRGARWQLVWGGRRSSWHGSWCCIGDTERVVVGVGLGGGGMEWWGK